METEKNNLNIPIRFVFAENRVKPAQPSEFKAAAVRRRGQRTDSLKATER